MGGDIQAPSPSTRNRRAGRAAPPPGRHRYSTRWPGCRRLAFRAASFCKPKSAADDDQALDQLRQGAAPSIQARAILVKRAEGQQGQLLARPAAAARAWRTMNDGAYSASGGRGAGDRPGLAQAIFAMRKRVMRQLAAEGDGGAARGRDVFAADERQHGVDILIANGRRSKLPETALMPATRRRAHFNARGSAASASSMPGSQSISTGMTLLAFS